MTPKPTPQPPNAAPSSILRCQKHGGHGFASDCEICAAPQAQGMPEAMSDDEIHDLTVAATRDASFDVRLKAALKLSEGYEILRTYAERLEGELVEYRETWTDSSQNTWRRPTAWAYAQTCRVQAEQRKRAERLEAELRRVRGGEAHLELLAIHKICLCVAECPPVEPGDTATVRMVKDLAHLVNRLSK